MKELIKRLKTDYPDLTFVEGALLCWSPEKRAIYYQLSDDKYGIYGVLHEIGHATLGHWCYTTDVDLVKKESQAWEKACLLAKKYGLSIDSEHVQDCLDTYREWLHKRSTCPLCGSKGIQSANKYHCINCFNKWTVSSARFLRPYRLKHKIH